MVFLIINSDDLKKNKVSWNMVQEPCPITIFYQKKINKNKIASYFNHK